MTSVGAPWRLVPELPEAETIAAGLRRPLAGRAVRSVKVIRSDLVDDAPGRFSESLTGRRIEGVTRRGKNVVLEVGGRTSPVADSAVLVVNLGMSGKLLHRPKGARSPLPSHPGLCLRLDDGSSVIYDDVRRFGRLRMMSRAEYKAWSHTLGPEPLSHSFTLKGLVRELARSSTPIRGWLLDQRRVAGVGNIYANEALFHARVHPRRPANRLTTTDARRLHRAIRSVLRAAVAASGTTLRDYRTAEGGRGSYAGQLRVYGKEGARCAQCNNEIRRIAFGGRSAFFCPSCQPTTGIGT